MKLTLEQITIAHKKCINTIPEGMEVSYIPACNAMRDQLLKSIK